MKFVACLVVVLGLAVSASAAPVSVGVMPLALAKIAGVSVQEASYRMPNGQVVAVRIFATTPEQRKRAQTLIDQLQTPEFADGQDAPEIRDDSGLSGFNGDTSWGWASIDMACSMLGIAAAISGGVNIWFDAGGALCAAYTLVDLGQRVGENIYNGYAVFYYMQNIARLGSLNIAFSGPTVF